MGLTITTGLFLFYSAVLEILSLSLTKIYYLFFFCIYFDIQKAFDSELLILSSVFSIASPQIYLMDIYIWYTLLSAIVGGVMGARARLGEVSIVIVCDNYSFNKIVIPFWHKCFSCHFPVCWLLITNSCFWQIRSIEMVHKRFESFPEAFVKNLVSSHTKRWPSVSILKVHVC